ncbi:hypothetical protein GCM10020331_057840 [Ectobacillus funiculus]
MQKIKSAKSWFFWSLLLWGGLATATGMISDVKWLMVIRFCIRCCGKCCYAFNACIPKPLVYESRAISRKYIFLILGNPVTVLWMSIVSGYLVESVGWRWMFILEGLPAVLWAFIWWKVVNDKPKEAKWLTDREKNNSCRSKWSKNNKA